MGIIPTAHWTKCSSLTSIPHQNPVLMSYPYLDKEGRVCVSVDIGCIRNDGMYKGQRCVEKYLVSEWIDTFGEDSVYKPGKELIPNLPKPSKDDICNLCLIEPVYGYSRGGQFCAKCIRKLCIKD